MDDQQRTQSLVAKVEEEQSGLRLDAYWTWKLDGQGMSRNQIRQWIKDGRAMVNNRPCSKPAMEVRAGDHLVLYQSDQAEGIQPDVNPIQIVWQDQDLAVINKTPGLSVHPAPSEKESTVVHRLVHTFPQLQAMDALRPGIVHRLDKDTSGLLLVALNEKTRAALSRALSAREVEKEYLALVYGCPEQFEAWIDLPLGRDQQHKTRMAVQDDQGRSAQTWYKVLHIFDHIPCSLLRVRIITGRTHQIRVHLAHIGHAVLGDRTYGPRQMAMLDRSRPDVTRILNRQMLHAWHLGLRHPRTGEWLDLGQGVPKDFLRTLLKVQHCPQRVGITGSAGSGKSALTALVAKERIPVWSADQVVAELYAPGADGWEMFRRSFGERFVPNPFGPVDKKAVFDAMQSSTEERKAILNIIHPLVEHSWKKFCAEHEKSRIVLAEVPLLFEGKWKERGLVDVSVNVFTPSTTRHQRLAENRGWNTELIIQMQAWQMPDEEKSRLADINVPNAGSLCKLEQAARDLTSRLLDLRREKVHAFTNRLKTCGVI